jgi:lysophospholipase L1-like esterase
MAESGTGDTGAGREGRPALRRATGVVAYLLVCALVALVGFELMARWAWRDGWRDPDDHGGPQGKALPTYVGLLELARPNLRGINRNVYFRTDSHGVRGPERAVKPPPGVFRILVAGDSVTMGAGVPEEDRYTERLEERVSEGLGERRGEGVEVVNLGLSGLNADRVVARIEELWRYYPSDLLVYGFTANDIEGPAYRHRAVDLPPAEFAERYWGHVRRLERSPSYFHRFLGSWRLAWERGDTDPHTDIVHNWLENPEAWDHFVAALDRYAGFARARGVCAHVFVHTHLGQLDERHPYAEVYARVEAAALARGLSVSQSFDTLARDAAGDPDSLWVSLFDPHPNARGHALLADALYDGLGKLPAECFEPR